MEEKILKTEGGIPYHKSEVREFTNKDMQNECDYFRAQKIAESMRLRGLISLSQFDKLTALNRLSFSPYLAEIMPKVVDNNSVQS